MIFVILTNTEMCNVHISMILEGLEYCILSRKGFAEVTLNLEDFPPYAFSYVMHFDVPSILCVWGIINISGDIWYWHIIISKHIYTTV